MISSNELKQSGFEGFLTIAQLKMNLSQIPLKQGVYVIIYPSSTPVQFLRIGTAGHFKDKDPNVSLSELESNWVPDTDIIYIGKAGGASSNATLQSRLTQYLEFGMGKKFGHWGGRFIWQIKDSDQLVVCWKPTEKEAREVECEMIEQFKQKHGGKRPFANLAD